MYSPAHRALRRGAAVGSLPHDSAAGLGIAYPLKAANTMKCRGPHLQISRLAVDEEPRQGSLQQLQKVPQAIGHLVELGFVQRRHPRPLDDPARANDIRQAATVRANDQATGLLVRPDSNSAVLLEPQKDITYGVDEVAVADVRPGDVADAVVEGDQG